MTDRFRLGFVGTGRMVREAHLPAALALSCIEVSALVDPAVERAQSLVDRYNLRAAVAPTVHEIMDLVDGVLIATPNDLHCPLALACIQEKVNVLIEKPMGTSVRECEEVVAASDRHDVIVAVGYQTRFLPSVGLAKRLLWSGHYGHPQRFASQFGAGSWSPLSGYTLEQQAIGGGVLVVSATHYLDRILFWFGYPSRVTLEDDSKGGPEANARATFLFNEMEHGEVHGILMTSKTVPLATGFSIQTDEGIFVFREHDPRPIRFIPNQRPEIEHVLELRQMTPAARDPCQLQLLNFVDSCRRNEEPLVGAWQGLENVRLIQDLYSNRERMQENWYQTRREVHRV